jgi:hypothetical protein
VVSLLTGLSCYLTLDEAANSTRNDSTANAKNFTDLNSNVGQVAGKIGSAASFTNTLNQVLNIGSAILPSGALSVALWFNPATSPPSSTNGLWGQTVAGAARQQLKVTTNGTQVTQIRCGTDTSDDIIFSSNLPNSTWTHIAFTFDGGTAVALYINGALAATGTTGGYSTGATLTTIGNVSATGTSVKGAIDEVGMWARKLSAGEISQVFNFGQALAYPLSGSAGGLGGSAQRARRHGLRFR